MFSLAKAEYNAIDACKKLREILRIGEKNAMENKSCQSRSFKGLMVAQFLEAFNGNALKVLVSLFAMRVLPLIDAARFIGIVGALFVIPFIVFSLYAGFWPLDLRKVT